MFATKPAAKEKPQQATKKNTSSFQTNESTEESKRV
jgi:hypothetical protein